MKEIQELVAELGRRDAKLQVFGAAAHRYRTAPAKESAVKAFEKKHGVSLPPEFREFLLTVTDGGVGPGYGLFALVRAPDDDVVEDLARLRHPFTEELLYREDEDEDEDEDGDWNEPVELRGTMTLCHYGCARRAHLVVTGPFAGRVLVDRFCDGAGFTWFQRAMDGSLHSLKRARSNDTTPLSFAAWYRDWLEVNLAATH